jgi:hypothetical protein
LIVRWFDGTMLRRCAGALVLWLELAPDSHAICTRSARTWNIRIECTLAEDLQAIRTRFAKYIFKRLTLSF